MSFVQEKKTGNQRKVILSLRKISFLAKIVDGFQPLIQLISKKPSSQMFGWILNKLLVQDKSRDHVKADKKLVDLPGNTSIQPGSIVMVRSPFDDIYILKIILLCQFENFTAIINNSLEKKSFIKGRNWIEAYLTKQFSTLYLNLKYTMRANYDAYMYINAVRLTL